jgi:hypothetical protein
MLQNSARFNLERANMRKQSPRNYKAEYARRIARGLARGLSHSQARGHPKAAETPARSPRRLLEDIRIQLALRTLRQERNIAKAAKAAKVSPERLRKYAVERRLIEKKGRSWDVRKDLPRRMLLFSNGRSLVITVADFQSASLVGQYMATVKHFLERPDRSVLRPFVDQAVRDVSGKEHRFETRPNVLYKLSAAGEHTFEQIYRIVI